MAQKSAGKSPAKSGKTAKRGSGSGSKSKASKAAKPAKGKRGATKAAAATALLTTHKAKLQDEHVGSLGEKRLQLGDSGDCKSEIRTAPASSWVEPRLDHPARKAGVAAPPTDIVDVLQ